MFDEIIYNDKVLENEEKMKFVKNLKFTNSVLMKIIDKILIENNNSIIIINGDHGFRGESTNRGMGDEMKPVSFDEIIYDYNTILAIFSQTEIDFPSQVSNVNVFKTKRTLKNPMLYDQFKKGKELLNKLRLRAITTI